MTALGLARVSRKADAPVQGALSAEALFRRHAIFVAKLLVRLGARPQEIDDLVQEVFLTAHRRGGYVSSEAKPTTWLAAIALRVLGTATRSRRRRRRLFEEDGAAPERGDPVDLFEVVSGATVLQRVFDAMEVEQVALIILYEIEGDSCESIAAALRIPVGTVYSRLHAARRAFREIFERIRDEKPARKGPGT